MARIALAKSHSKWAARLYSQRFPLSFRPSEARGEIYFLLHFSAAIGFQAATGGAPFGCASLRPLPESTASSLHDNLHPTSLSLVGTPSLYLQGPSPCPLRGWICPPYGSLKAIHRSVTSLSFRASEAPPVISSNRRESRNLSSPRPIPS